MNLKQKYIFIGILSLGIVLRIVYLGNILPGFFRDEAAIGYNAYSIWKTGMDEYGKSFPLVFRSFEGFFLPVYLYFLSPIVGIFGLTEFNTRILSSIAGIAALLFIYLIGKKIFGIKTGLFAMFLLAISPWHIFYSRGAFEGNLALTLFTAGFYFWLNFSENLKVRYFLLSTTLFILSMYTYQTERIVVPLVGLAALVLWFKKIWKVRTSLVLPIIAIAIFLIPMFYISTRAAGVQRAANVSLFSSIPPGYSENIPENFIGNNHFYLRAKQVGALYASYFSPRNLFFEGDYDRQRSVDNMSVFYFFMFPLIVTGFWRLIRRGSVYDKLLTVWILSAPIPAAMTSDPFHTYRSLMLYLPLTLVAGLGASYFYKKLRYKKIYLLLFCSISFIGLTYFIFNYAVITAASRARNWDYGYKEIVSYLNTIPNKGKIIVDDMWTEPYIHFLFFNKENSELYQLEVANMDNPSNYYYESKGRVRPFKYGNYEFRKVDWASERGDVGNIFVIYAKNLPEDAFKTDPNVKLFKEIQYPNGEIAYRIVQII